MCTYFGSFCPGFKYAGIQYGNQCRCDNDFGIHGKVDDSECDAACAGESSPPAENQQKCGGDWRNSVYSTAYKGIEFVHVIAWSRIYMLVNWLK